jgi:hypothetical protein
MAWGLSFKYDLKLVVATIDAAILVDKLLPQIYNCRNFWKGNHGQP